MTIPRRTTTPALVMRMAGEAPDDVPLYLAELDDEALTVVSRMADTLSRYVTEVIGHRWVARAWERAGGQMAVDHHTRAAHAGLDAAGAPVWSGGQPRWPTDPEHAPPPVHPVHGLVVEGTVPASAIAAAAGGLGGVPDADRTQVIPSATIAAADHAADHSTAHGTGADGTGQYGPLAELTARDTTPDAAGTRHDHPVLWFQPPILTGPAPEQPPTVVGLPTLGSRARDDGTHDGTHDAGDDGDWSSDGPVTADPSSEEPDLSPADVSAGGQP